MNKVHTDKTKARMTRKQKLVFRQSILRNYERARVDKHLWAKNIIIGDIDKAKTIIMAHYDTPPKLPTWFMKHMYLWTLIGLPIVYWCILYTMFHFATRGGHSGDYIIHIANISQYIIPILLILYFYGGLGGANPINMNDNTSGVLTVLDLVDKTKQDDRYAFVLFDNEEKGLFGSIAFRFRYRKRLKNKRLIVLDCVGVGDVLMLYTVGKCTPVAKDLIEVHDDASMRLIHKKSTPSTMSDHVSFRGLNHVLLLMQYEGKRNSLSTIHTINDDWIDMRNINKVAKLILQI